MAGLTRLLTRLVGGSGRCDTKLRKQFGSDRHTLFDQRKHRFLHHLVTAMLEIENDGHNRYNHHKGSKRYQQRQSRNGEPTEGRLVIVRRVLTTDMSTSVVNTNRRRFAGWFLCFGSRSEERRVGKE